VTFAPLLLMLGVGQAAAQPVQPADVIELCYRDSLKLSDDEALVTRWLWLQGGDGKAKKLRWQVLSGKLNEKSRGRRVVPPPIVLLDGTIRLWPNVADADWEQAWGIRVNLDAYHFSAEVWDNLDFHDLQFHAPTLVVYTDGSTRKVIAQAPWLLEPLGVDPAQRTKDVARRAQMLVGLIVRGGYCRTPVVADWYWVWESDTQFNRRAGYADFLGFKDRKTYEDLIGFDEKASLKFARPLLESVSDSGVAYKARGLEFWEKIGGIYVRTLDQVAHDATGNRNPLADTNLGYKKLVFDANETFGNLPNGFWAFGLFNADGTRQDSAPDGVGYAHQTLTNDGKIGYQTCIWCHDSVAGRGGLAPFRPYFRSLYVTPGPLALAAGTRKKFRDVTEEYLTNLDQIADDGRRRYTAALQQATGLETHVYAREAQKIYTDADGPFTLEQFAVMLCVTPKQLVDALNATLLATGTVDSTLANFLLPDGARAKVGLDAIRDAAVPAQLALRGLRVWPADLRVKFPQRK
jgi:hypothetical protein